MDRRSEGEQQSQHSRSTVAAQSQLQSLLSRSWVFPTQIVSPDNILISLFIKWVLVETHPFIFCVKNQLRLCCDCSCD